MTELTWSKSEKKIARQAFDLAADREMAAIRREVEQMLQTTKENHVVWEVHDYLHKRSREMNGKYEFRGSTLLFVLTALLRDGWLTENDLEGLRPDKFEALRKLSSISF